MKEKILALLKTKFPGVQDAVLNRIAVKKSVTVTGDADPDELLEGITIQSVIESYGDARATESANRAVVNYERKHGLKNGKAVAPRSRQAQPGGGETEELKKTVSELVKLVTGIAASVAISGKTQSARELFDRSKLPGEWFTRIDVTSGIPVGDQIRKLRSEYGQIRQRLISEIIGWESWPADDPEPAAGEPAEKADGEPGREIAGTKAR